MTCWKLKTEAILTNLTNWSWSCLLCLLCNRLILNIPLCLMASTWFKEVTSTDPWASLISLNQSKSRFDSLWKRILQLQQWNKYRLLVCVLEVSLHLSPFFYIVHVPIFLEDWDPFEEKSTHLHTFWSVRLHLGFLIYHILTGRILSLPYADL